MSLKNACMLPVGLLLLASSPALARKWTDNTGKYSVEAELVEVKGDDALLKKPDGSIIPVPINRLSDADRRYVEHLNKQTGETQGRLKTPQEQPPSVAEPRPVAKEPKGTTVPTGGREAVIAEIEKVRGYYQCNEQRPDRPIEEVRLSGRHVTDFVLEHLKGLTDLQRLTLYDTQVSDAGLEHLKGLTGLQVLLLNKTGITDAGLEHLKGLTRLHLLVLTETRVTDAVLERLKGLTGLRYLLLDKTEITDVGLEHLKGLTRLERLNLNETWVTEAGVNDLRRTNKALRDVISSRKVARPETVAKREAPPGQGGVIIQDTLSPWATPNETIILGPSTEPEQTIISDGGITVKGTRLPFISSKSITVIWRDGQIVVYEDDRKAWEATDIDRMPLWLRERVEE